MCMHASSPLKTAACLPHPPSPRSVYTPVRIREISPSRDASPTRTYPRGTSTQGTPQPHGASRRTSRVPTTQAQQQQQQQQQRVSGAGAPPSYMSSGGAPPPRRVSITQQPRDATVDILPRAEPHSSVSTYDTSMLTGGAQGAPPSYTTTPYTSVSGPVFGPGEGAMYGAPYGVYTHTPSASTTTAAPTDSVTFQPPAASVYQPPGSILYQRGLAPSAATGANRSAHAYIVYTIWLHAQRVVL